MRGEGVLRRWSGKAASISKCLSKSMQNAGALEREGKEPASEMPEGRRGPRGAWDSAQPRLGSCRLLARNAIKHH